MKRSLQIIGETMGHEWNQFWFTLKPKSSAIYFRIFVGATLFVFYLLRLIEFDHYFSNQGILPFDLSRSSFFSENQSDLFSFILQSDNSAYVGHLVFLVALALMTLGLWTRRSALVALLLHSAFIQRNFMMIYGADYIAGLWLFSLVFMKSDFKKVGPKWQNLSDLCHSVGVRLAQIQVCLIYGWSGFEKLRGVSWWEGTALWRAMNHPDLVSINFKFLAYVPWVFVIPTLLTVLWEVYFPVLVWNRRVRPALLLLGVVFHVLVAVVLNLYTFSLLMLAPYVLFLDDATLTRLLQRLKIQSPTKV